MSYDAAVIGSGVSGLSSALILAQHGRKVALFEKEPVLAPLLHRFRRGDVLCDPGVHYIGGLAEGGAFLALLRYLGVADGLQEVRMDEEGYDCFAGPEGPIMRLPQGMEAVREALCSSFPKSRGAIDLYIERVTEVLDTTPMTNLDLHPRDFSPKDEHQESLGPFLRAAGAEEELCGLLGTYGEALYGTRPDETPIYIHAMVVGSFLCAAHTFRQGGDSIVQAFEGRLAEEGVDVFTGRGVETLEVDDGRRVKGVVTTDGEIIGCEACVSTIHPKLLKDLLPKGSVRPAFLSRMRDLEETTACFGVFLDVPEIPREVRNANFMLGKRGFQETEGMGIVSIMACDPTDYGYGRKALAVLRKAWPSSADASCFAPGRHGFCPEKGAENAAYEEYVERGVEEVVKDLCDVFPQLKGACKVAGVSTPCDFERWTGTANGSMYGVKHSTHHLPLIPPTPIHGLFLAGQSLNVPGVMGAVTSAFRAAAYVLGWDPIWERVLKCR